MPFKHARRYFVRGRVQGVGFRYFVKHSAQSLGLDGYVKNLADGSVEVYAIGTGEQLHALAAQLWKGPRWSEVHNVEEREEPLHQCRGFEIEH
ncbi:MAG: acylphosphatase [Acidimicrobiia bacterium]|nr:acylphosphatase [Acidimicrobiia bacterium]